MRFLLILLLPAWSALPVLAMMAAERQEGPVLQVLVYDLAGVSGDTLQEAEDEASAVFRSAGAEIRWINCSRQQLCDVTSAPRALFLRVLPRPPKGQGHNEAIGRSYLVPNGSSDYLDVYLETVRNLTERNGFVRDSRLLAYAMAHEIGHILLGAKHNPATVMRGQWSGADLAAIHHRRVHFSRQEGEAIRAAVRARTEPAGSNRNLAIRGIPGDSILSRAGDRPGIQ